LQALVEALDLNTLKGYKGASFMIGNGDEELIRKVAKGDAEAKLNLVKDYLDLIVEIAAEHSKRNGKSFFQLIQAGILAIIRAAEKSCNNSHICFIDCARDEISKSMKEII